MGWNRTGRRRAGLVPGCAARARVNRCRLHSDRQPPNSPPSSLASGTPSDTGPCRELLQSAKRLPFIVPLFKYEGDQQVDAVANDGAVLYVDRLLLDPRRRDATQCRAGAIQANLHGIFETGV